MLPNFLSLAIDLTRSDWREHSISDVIACRVAEHLDAIEYVLASSALHHRLGRCHDGTHQCHFHPSSSAVYGFQDLDYPR